MIQGLPNVKFYHYNEWDQLTIVASEEETNFPASNTQTRLKTKVWKFDAVSGTVTAKINGSAIGVTGVFLMETNFTASATVKIQGSNNDFVATLLDQQLLQNANGRDWAFIFDTEKSYDDYRISISDATNPNALQYIGRIWLTGDSDIFEPAVGYGDNSNPDGIPVDPSVVSVADGRERTSLQKDHYRNFSFTWRALQQQSAWLTMFADVGTSREFFFVKKPLSNNDTIDYEDYEDNFVYGSIKTYSNPRVINDIYGLQLNIEEES
jgi:hypothetical protein